MAIRALVSWMDDTMLDFDLNPVATMEDVWALEPKNGFAFVLFDGSTVFLQMRNVRTVRFVEVTRD